MFSILMAIIQITGIFIAIQILTNKVFSIKEGLVTIAIAMLAFPLFTISSILVDDFCIDCFCKCLILEK